MTGLFLLNDWIVVVSTSDYHSGKRALLKINLRLAASAPNHGMVTMTARIFGDPAIVLRWDDPDIGPLFFLADTKTVLCSGGGNGDRFSLWDFSIDEDNSISGLQRCKVRGNRPAPGALYSCNRVYCLADMTDMMTGEDGVVKQVLITGGNGGVICIWNLEEMKAIKSHLGHRSDVMSIVCPAANRLISVVRGRSFDEVIGGSIRAWDMLSGSGDCLRILTGTKHCEHLTVLFSNKDVILFACNLDTIYFWSWSTNEILIKADTRKLEVFGASSGGSLLRYCSQYNILEMLGK